ncbi:hypothetical protein HMPREF1624_06634 [Sporothrix schenckii ATCC 58251]|uniref:Concanavalin A-like lectin/glucanase n=1 Tax=Sporothrix schenckii (strain ATCC 58251 / de Perez 2211183) TaxID=1391915 RepID=U7PNY3_SPOS1|nr:hypothetical protein HMPREF1624_06634 [Sporothrix schenckii ATCC 58251]
MKSVLLSIAATLAAAVGLATAAPAARSTFAADELELLAPEIVRSWRQYDVAPPPSSNATTAAAPHAGTHNSNTTTCGAFQSVEGDAPMYIAATAVFAAPKVAARPAFNWTRDPAVTPRIAVSTGVDGFACPELVRAGIYATVYENGTQQHVPFVEFSGKVYAVKIASVAAGESVRVRVSIVQDDIVNINWSNLNRTDQFFDKDVPTASSMCGQSVAWLVEDLVPVKAGPGDFFAAFEPIHFTVSEGDRMDGKTTKFDAATASYTTEQALCKVDESGTDLVVTSS